MGRLSRHRPSTRAGEQTLRLGAIVLGSFCVIRELSRGAYATVYVARELDSGRRAVVKIPRACPADMCARDAVRAHFAAEQAAAARVSHPNVVAIYGAGETVEGVPILAMEYVPGRPLKSLLMSQAPLPLPKLAELGNQLGAALCAIHEAGIIHRDINPRNIVVDDEPDGRARYVLLDFGAAMLTDGPGLDAAKPQGTPRYMPREQASGHAVARSDIFGLGAVLWWALTGQEHLAEIQSISQLMLRQVAQSIPPDPRRLRPDIPKPVAEYVSQMLHPEAAHRPSAQQFAARWPELIGSWAGVTTRRYGYTRSPSAAGL